MSDPALRAAVDAVVVLLVVMALGVAGWWLSSVAVRLDRLQRRVETSRAALDAALLRRAAATEALAVSGLLDPASSLILLADAAEATAPGTGAQRVAAEDDLAAALRAVLDADAVGRVHAAPGGSALLADLDAACQRLVLARAFADDALAGAAALRGRPVVAALHLAGRSVLPGAMPVDTAAPDLSPSRRQP